MQLYGKHALVLQKAPLANKMEAWANKKDLDISNWGCTRIESVTIMDGWDGDNLKKTCYTMLWFKSGQALSKTKVLLEQMEDNELQVQEECYLLRMKSVMDTFEGEVVS